MVLVSQFFILKPFRAIAWSFVKGMVQRQFPQVQSISTTKLANWRLDELPPPVLIDVRQEEEYAVSHLPGASHLPTVEAIQQADIPTDATLVLYCSVGYRSARLAEKLQAMGYKNVMNLEGSIFEWYNQGHPVVADGSTPVQRVHHYNRIWGLLLDAPE
ncbi:MAG: rhodanese-like domain-containing protein [Thainema sp.]